MPRRQPLTISHLSSIAAISVALVAPRAHAQSADAEALFNDGDRMLAEGQLEAACEAFEASNRIEQRAGTLIKLGECRERNHQLASAWSSYKDALTRVRDPKKKQLAAAKVAALEPRLSFLTVSVADEARIDGLALTRNGKPFDAGLWNRAVPVDGGTYVIGGRAPGHEEWSTTVTVPVESGKISVEVPKFKEIAKLVAPPPAPAETTDDAEPPEPPRGLWTRRRYIALGSGGVAAAALATGIVLGLQSRSNRSEALGLCPDPQAACADADRANALIATARSRAVTADIAFGVAGAAAIAAGVLWFTGAPERHHRVTLVPHPTGIAVAGSF